ncbi:gas vesicle protein GvpC [Chrysosporum ovalisporum APH033B]|uniref:gas vesicle protein GvpC n=1 Tax=Umezakia ovalisporum TaxID=75695 RepID=UPI002473EE45|nr:gas vesicle protein GvpC [Umezakia ovalisporum]MDH6067123.1 gas vesicle protein GvpC [Umezakia ovalisporum APH033B]
MSVALMQRIHQENRSLAQATQEFLATTANERFAQAQQQAAELRAFQQKLEQETNDFLAATAEERIAKAQKQRQDLSQFRQDLFMSVIGVPVR